MSDKLTGGPAFPQPPHTSQNGSTGETTNFQWTSDGMTLRDYFAAKAMVIGYKYWTEIFYPLVDPDGDDHPFGTDHDNLVEHIAEEAYLIADAMLKARDK